MRELKFRAWSEDKRDYIAFDFIGFANDGKRNEIYYDREQIASSCIAEQFTGLRDKNGRDIYEGDIVEMVPGFGCEWEPRICVIEWERAGFRLRCGSQSWPLDDHDCSLKIIGNIHETPELLKRITPGGRLAP